MLNCLKYNGAVFPHVDLTCEAQIKLLQNEQHTLPYWTSKMKINILILNAFAEKRMTRLCFQAPGKVYEKQQEKNRVYDSKPA